MSAAAKVLERARAAGVQLEARGGRLAYDAPPDVSPDLLAQLRERKAELLELLRHGERRGFLDLPTDPEARARWLRAPIGTLSPSRVPHHWPAARWPQLIVDAESFCRDWAEKAFLLGWPIWELFGCHRRAPWGRIQGMGLVLLLQGDEIAALTAAEAVMRTPAGAHQTYRRKHADPLHPAERCLVPQLGPTRPIVGSTPTRSTLLNAASFGSSTPPRRPLHEARTPRPQQRPRLNNRMKADQLPEHAADFTTEQDACLAWLEWELARQLGNTFFGRAQDGGV